MTTQNIKDPKIIDALAALLFSLDEKNFAEATALNEEVLESCQLQLIDGSHYKYYHLTLLKTANGCGSYIANWGRIGSKPQTQRKDFPSLYHARDAFHAKYDEKKRKGYQTTKNKDERGE